MNKLKSLAFALAFGASMGTANAVLVDVTYTGTIVNGQDSFATFGGAGVEIGNSGRYRLDGLAFVAVYRFDTDLGVLTTSPTQNLLQGGTIQSNTSPALMASFTVGGVTVSSAITTLGQMRGFNSSGTNVSRTQHLARENPLLSPGDAFNFILTTTFYQNGTDISKDLSAPAFYDSSLPGFSAGLSSGQFSYDVVINNSVIHRVGSNLDIESVRIASVASGVPEPSTWAMMLIGFAGLGYAARRRAQASAA